MFFGYDFLEGSISGKEKEFLEVSVQNDILKRQNGKYASINKLMVAFLKKLGGMRTFYALKSKRAPYHFRFGLERNQSMSFTSASMSTTAAEEAFPAYVKQLR